MGTCQMTIMILGIMLLLQLATTITPIQKYEANAQHTIIHNTNSNSTISDLIKNNGHSELPQVVTSGNNVYVVWQDDRLVGNRDVFLRRSTDGGNTFDSRIIDLSKNDIGRGGAFSPKITALDNNVYVVWESTPENNGQIFFSKSNDGANTFRNPINLGNNTGFSGSPQIAVSKRNYVYVVWHNAGNGIEFRRSTDGGNTFDRAINLSNNIALSFLPQLAVSDKDDNIVYAAWLRLHPYIQGQQQHQQERLLQYDIVFRKSIDRGQTFEDKSINLVNSSAGFAEDLRLATSQTNVYVLWTNGTIVLGNYPDLTDIVFAKSLDNGNKFDNAVNINNYTGWSFNPQLAVFGNNVYVVWNETPHEKNGEIMFRRSINNGTTFESKIISLSSSTEQDSFDERIIITAIKSKTSVNDIYVVWDANTTNGNDEIFLRRSANGGNTFDNIINLSSNRNDNDNNILAQDPQIAFSKTGNNVYVTWDANTTAHNEEIFLRHITAAATMMTTKKATIVSSYDKATHFKEVDNNTTTAAISENTNNCISNIRGTCITIGAAPANIAIIRPTFTAAAYDNAFYIFYKANADTTFGTNIRTHIGLLSNTITNKTISQDALSGSSEAAIRYLVDHLKWLMPKSNVTVLADQDVHNGYIFKKEEGDRNNTNRNNDNLYDVIILGHQEYVSQKEYDNLKKFVTNGGTLFLMDGNMLYAEVKYDNKTKAVTLTKGHNWEFNGKSAWRSIGERWKTETSQWVGSNYLCYSCKIIFLNNPFGYEHREEQYITNPKDKILLDYNASIVGRQNASSIDNINNITDYQSDLNDNAPQNDIAKTKIATYELDYGKGKVVSLGIYADDIIDNYMFNKFLDSLLLKYALKGRR